MPSHHPSRHKKKAKGPKRQIQLPSECHTTHGDDREEMARTKPKKSPKTASEPKLQEQEMSERQTSSNLRFSAGIPYTANVLCTGFGQISLWLSVSLLHCRYLLLTLWGTVFCRLYYDCDKKHSRGLIFCVSRYRQSGRATGFEATGPGAGGWQRCTQINSSSPKCGAESISGSLPAIVQTRGITEIFSKEQAFS